MDTEKVYVKDNESSGTNLALVIVFIIIVGLLVWWLTARKAPTQTDNTPNVNVDLNLPDTGGSGGTNTGGGTGGSTGGTNTGTGY